MIKDIQVFALAHEGGVSAFELAEALATRTGAQLRCTAYLVLPDGYLGYSESLESSATAQARRDQRPDLLRLQDDLKARNPALALDVVEAFPKGLIASVAERSRRSDAIVVRAPPQSHETFHSTIIEAALFEGAAPVFVTPLHWHARALAKRILICWDGSREAARAAHEALRFAAADAHLVIASVADHPETYDEASARSLAAHLERGGITTETQLHPNPAGDAAAMLDHIAQDVSADLIVLGGYRHPRLQEALFGGVTRSILRAPRVPLLLAH